MYIMKTLSYWTVQQQLFEHYICNVSAPEQASNTWKLLKCFQLPCPGYWGWPYEKKPQGSIYKANRIAGDSPASYLTNRKEGEPKAYQTKRPGTI